MLRRAGEERYLTPLRRALVRDGMAAMAGERQREAGAVVETMHRREIPRHARRVFEAMEHSAAMAYAGAAMKQVDDDLLFFFDEAAEEFVRTEAAQHITAIDEETREQVRRVLMEAQEEALSEDQAARRLRSRLQTMAGFRARRIARTEMLAAHNLGLQMGAEALSRRTGQQFVKLWIARLDDEVRDDHLDADGQEVDLRDSFEVGGELLRYPGDPQGSARNIVNCRCTMIFANVT